MKVFIDGENLRHRLVSVLFQEKLIRDRDEIYTVDVHKLLAMALGRQPDAIRYYTTNIVEPEFEVPELLLHKIRAIQEAHKHWTDMLAGQGVEVVRAGNLKVKESNRCYHCGRRTMVLHEKGVDVRLAAEVVLAATRDGEKDIVVVSSDTDMIPALEIARMSGARITYLCFSEEVSESLVQAADMLVTYNREQVVENFRGLVPSKHLPLYKQSEQRHIHGSQPHQEEYHGH